MPKVGPNCMKPLRQKIYLEDFDQRMLAKEIGKGEWYISQRMNGKGDWHLQDVYQICRLLHIPMEEIPKYFPVKEAPR